MNTVTCFIAYESLKLALKLQETMLNVKGTPTTEADTLPNVIKSYEESLHISILEKFTYPAAIFEKLSTVMKRP